MANIWRPLLIAAVLAGSLYDWHESLAKRVRQRRSLSALVMTLGVVLLILLPLAGLAITAVHEAIAAISFVREALEAGGVTELISRLPQPARDWAREAIDFLPQLQQNTTEQLANGGKFAAVAITGAISKTTAVIVNLVLMLIGFNFMLSDGHRLVHWLERCSPMRPGQMRELLHEFRVVAKSVLGSTIATAVAQGVLAGVGYAIAGIPQWIFFGLLTVFSSFVPAIGTSLVALPLVGALFILGHPVAAVFLLIWATVIVGLVDNLLKPFLIKGGMRLHGALVFFSLLGGIMYFGTVGLVVGPLAVAFVMTMVRLGHRDFRSTSSDLGR